MKKIFSIVIAIAVIFCSYPLHAIIINWAQYKGNSEHDGFFPGMIVQTNNRGWTRTTGVNCGQSSTPIVYSIGGVSKIYWNMEDGIRIFDEQGNRAGIIDSGYPVEVSPAIENDIIFFCSRDSLIAQNLIDSARWSQYVGKNATAPVIKNGKIVVCAGKKVFCYSDSGTLEWTKNLAASVDPNTTPAIDDSGNVFAATEQDTISDWRLYCFSVNGIQKWEYISHNYEPTGIHSPITIVGSSKDEIILVSTSPVDTQWTSSLYAINIRGLEAWERLINMINSSPAIYGDTAYCAEQDGITAIRISNNSTIWHYETGPITNCSPIVGGDGTVYVGTDSGTVLAVKKNGILSWNDKTQEGSMGNFSVGSDGSLFAASLSGKLLAYKRPIGTQEKENIGKMTIAVFPTVSSTIFAIQAPERAILHVYDIAGKLVKTVKGSSWNGTNELNQKLPSGMYFMNFTYGERTVTKKLIWMK